MGIPLDYSTSAMKSRFGYFDRKSLLTVFTALPLPDNCKLVTNSLAIM